jgi:hypothetical protein
MTMLLEQAPRAKLRPLENGEHLDAEEFLRRYEASPEVKKAELIQGRVYMAIPVSTEHHGLPENILQGWVSLFSSATPGVEGVTNSTVCLGFKNVPQPDVFLQLRPEYGGQSHIDEKGYTVGPPELAVEIAASSSNIDSHEKRDAYLEAGIREYLLWRTFDQQVDWWFLQERQYLPIQPDARGVLRSKIFPGLWLDSVALLKRDRSRIIECLQEGIASPEHKRFLDELAKRAQSRK